ncbi:conserved hypothetical protein [Culex quinquefasciatus]|uniref:G-protein coupled receptors family 2 profile 2 domain-containing protein n=1 Tax=Culex quinquefasciatus TaxID=7176 RepID=B0XIS0_CULQU|nr:conserved hypothetical protein [Culex quinquefasciatus]|eukprot:XP_001869542.1 conserved hypothetical protein [Culex quinquefasciatus]
MNISAPEVSSDLRPTSLEKSQEICRLRIYEVYAWGVPFVIAGVAAILDNLPDTVYLRPRFGERTCWFYGDMEILTYFFGPVGILLCINLLLFASTARQLTCGLWKRDDVKSTTERAALGRVCMKLVVVMGVTWVADVASWVFGGPDYIWLVTDLINALQGVFIFIVVGCQPQGMLDDHHYTGNEVPGHKLRPSCYVTTLGGQVHINIVDLLTTEVRSEIQRDEYAATSPHRVVSSRRALLKEKLRTIEAEQSRQEQEIERRLEAKQREFDEAMHRIKERRRQIEEETAVRLLQLQICKSTSIAESKQRTGRRGRDDEFIRMDSQQQKSRNELPLVKRILQDPSCINSSHTSLTFPGRSDVNFRPPSVPHVLETLRTSFYSSRYLYSAVHQRHLSETLRKWPAGAEFCNWTSRAKKQIHHSMTTNARSLKQTPLNAASSPTQHRDTKLLTLYPIAFDDTGQQWFVIVFRYCDDRNQSVWSAIKRLWNSKTGRSFTNTTHGPQHSSSSHGLPSMGESITNNTCTNTATTTTTNSANATAANGGANRVPMETVC